MLNYKINSYSISTNELDDYFCTPIIRKIHRKPTSAEFNDLISINLIVYKYRFASEWKMTFTIDNGVIQYAECVNIDNVFDKDNQWEFSDDNNVQLSIESIVETFVDDLDKMWTCIN